MDVRVICPSCSESFDRSELGHAGEVACPHCQCKFALPPQPVETPRRRASATTTLTDADFLPPTKPKPSAPPQTNVCPHCHGKPPKSGNAWVVVIAGVCGIMTLAASVAIAFIIVNAADDRREISGPVVDADDHGDAFHNASPVELTRDRVAVSMMGRFESDGDVDVLRITFDQPSALTAAFKQRPGSTVRGRMILFDALQNRLKAIDLDGSASEVVLRTDAADSSEYFVQLLADGTGRYELAVSVDSRDAEPESVRDLDVSGTGDATVRGNIAAEGEVDRYRLQAPFDGTLIIRQTAAAGSRIDCVLTIHDADLNEIASADDNLNARDAELVLPVARAAEYFIDAAGYGGPDQDPDYDGTGAYELTISGILRSANDAIGGEFPSATLLEPNGDLVEISSEIDDPADEDLFRIVVPRDALMSVDLIAPVENSTLDPMVVVYDDRETEVGRSDDGGRNTDSRLALRVAAGETYFLRASASDAALDLESRTGPYLLLVTFRDPAPDTPDTIEEAAELAFDDTGLALHSEQIDRSGDRDLLRVIATQAGRLRIQQIADDAELDPFLRLRDAGGAELAADDDSGSNEGDALIETDVEAGDVIYIEAGAYVDLDDTTSTGRYTLVVDYVDPPTPADDFGNSPATSAIIDLPESGSRRIAGRIDTPGDVDCFSVAIPKEGTLAISTVTASEDAVTLTLEVLDVEERVVATGERFFTGEDLQWCTVTGTAGDYHYVRIRASADAPEPTGRYMLFIGSPSNPQSSPASAPDGPP